MSGCFEPLSGAHISLQHHDTCSEISLGQLPSPADMTSELGLCCHRFRCTDQLGSLFDAIDVHTQGNMLPPGTYRIVAQFPRRVFTEGTPGSLRDVGLAQAKQETVLIESIA